MTPLLTTVRPMTEIDPNSVKPGWVALLIVLALAAATVLLWRNMGKQLKRIDFDPSDGQPPAEDASAPGRAQSVDRPTTDSSADQAGAAAPATTDPEAPKPTR
ncbi:hypothetical protein F1D05_12300 [Kribbella qitaiheensis]|uniref:Uncharacterized protein n=1 Tax=Kribbella qitaiheensis TaxID=1544730 RepID=A0A7G6WX27_9ACTN|nr:hypothetical protein [Kribbella qitaiheensis]QNE18542.1 hypothetical protein F1D05_12300 [Kribbella qitaiheensis]